MNYVSSSTSRPRTPPSAITAPVDETATATMKIGYHITTEALSRQTLTPSVNHGQYRLVSFRTLPLTTEG